MTPHLTQANTPKSNDLLSNSAQSTRGVLSFIRSFLAAAWGATLVSSAPAWGSQESQAPAAPRLGRRLGWAGVCLRQMKGFCAGPACGSRATRPCPSLPALLPPATSKRAPVLPMLTKRADEHDFAFIDRLENYVGRALRCLVDRPDLPAPYARPAKRAG